MTGFRFIRPALSVLSLVSFGLAKPSKFERKVTIFGLTLFPSGNADFCEGMSTQPFIINQTLAALLSAITISTLRTFSTALVLSTAHGIGNWRQT